MYIVEIIWLASWPVMMWLTYKLTRIALKRLDEIVDEKN